MSHCLNMRWIQNQVPDWHILQIWCLQPAVIRPDCVRNVWMFNNYHNVCNVYKFYNDYHNVRDVYDINQLSDEWGGSGVAGEMAGLVVVEHQAGWQCGRGEPPLAPVRHYCYCGAITQLSPSNLQSRVSSAQILLILWRNINQRSNL